ncbi:hypothetical protein [Streptosporangium sp. NPDC049644]|uniref:ABC transporter permease n=1 Tax=Streptosporangium sp. NPDC049644 TaxID=3155507 RepID=UPI00342FB6B0
MPPVDLVEVFAQPVPALMICELLGVPYENRNQFQNSTRALSNADRAAYVGYLTPGIMITTIVGAAQGTAISVATDMTEGIIARFKTMAIARVSVLTGHVLGAMVQTFLGSGFVPTESMPTGLRWFAEHQPATPVIETLRALPAGRPAGSSFTEAAVWSAGIALVSYLWARRLYNR